MLREIPGWTWPRKRQSSSTKKSSDKKVVKKSSTVVIQPEKTKEELEEEKRKKAKSVYQEIGSKMSVQDSSTTKKMFEENPEKWELYHKNRDFSFLGYDQTRIPVNRIISILEKMKNKKPIKIADLGCGRNLIYQKFKDDKRFEITGYDYVSCNNSKVADISKLPDEDNKYHLCIFSQSLTGIVTGKQQYRDWETAIS